MEASSDPAARLLREADHYMDINRLEEARARYLEVLGQRPEDGYLHYRVGYCLYRMGEYAQAAVHCQEAIANGYAQATCYVVLGLTWRLQHKVALAEETFRKGLALHPASPNLLAQLAYLLWRQERYKEARQLIGEARALDPNHQTVLYYAYHMTPRRGRRSEAPVLIESYMQTNATEIDKKLFIVNDLIRTGRYRQAREECREAFVLDPLNRRVRDKMADIDFLCHPVNWPNRVMTRVGAGTAMVIVLVLVFVSQIFNTYLVGWLLALLYAWARLAPRIYAHVKSIWKGRRS